MYTAEDRIRGPMFLHLLFILLLCFKIYIYYLYSDVIFILQTSLWSTTGSAAWYTISYMLLLCLNAWSLRSMAWLLSILMEPDGAQQSPQPPPNIVQHNLTTPVLQRICQRRLSIIRGRQFSHKTEFQRRCQTFLESTKKKYPYDYLSSEEIVAWGYSEIRLLCTAPVRWAPDKVITPWMRYDLSVSFTRDLAVPSWILSRLKSTSIC
jgi:hypothetical protein